MQIKTTMKDHLTSVRMTIIKESTNSNCWRGCWEKGMLLNCWWECKLIQSWWRTVWRFLKTLKSRTAIIPNNPTTGHTAWENRNRIYMYPNVHCSTIYNSQNMEATAMSSNRWMGKEDVVHTYNGTLLHRQNTINIFQVITLNFYNVSN